MSEACVRCDGIIEIITNDKYPNELIELCWCGMILGHDELRYKK